MQRDLGRGCAVCCRYTPIYWSRQHPIYAALARANSNDEVRTMHMPHPHWLDVEIHHETMNSILIGLAAILGMTLATGLMAIIIRLASGRW